MSSNPNYMILDGNHDCRLIYQRGATETYQRPWMRAFSALIETALKTPPVLNGLAGPKYLRDTLLIQEAYSLYDDKSSAQNPEHYHGKPHGLKEWLDHSAKFALSGVMR